MSTNSYPSISKPGLAVPASVSAGDVTSPEERVLNVIRNISDRASAELWLHDDESLAELVLGSLPGAVYHLDKSGRFVRWNRNFERITGYSSSEITSMNILDFFAAEEHEHVNRWLSTARRSERATELEAHLRLKDRETIPYLFTLVGFEHLDEQGFVGIGTDVSDLKGLEESLREQRAQFEAQVESSLAGILVTDSQGGRIIQNRRLTEMWSIPDEILAPTDIKPQLQFAADLSKDPEGFIAKVAWLTAHPEEIGYDEIELKDGRVFDRYSGPVFGKDGRYYGRNWIHRDITERRESERRIQFLATHDVSTGLPNRHLIQEKICSAIVTSQETNQQFALLFLDLDRFKVINDGYGHPFGDEVLKETAKRLQLLVSNEGTVARYGGDEFLILLPRIESIDEPSCVATAILDMLDRPIMIQNREVYISSSVGVSVFPHDGETAESLIGNANLAMYHAKDLGRNNWQCFTRQMGEEVQCSVNVENRLRGAITSGSLQLAFQPKVDLKTGCITSCEALVRWFDPVLGNVSPAHFIPIAEDSGLIVPLGDWVLKAACNQAKRWAAVGHQNVAVAVNVSARQFLHQDMHAWVMGVLEQTGLPPELLEIELTESLIAQDVEKALLDVSRLRDAGVKFSIDDFGTGYSSLSHLNRFRVDTLKVDQSFVRNMLLRQDDANIVKAIISLANSLGFRSIAEGVETEEHCQLLQELGCDEIQGYYFSRPVPAAEFEAMLDENKKLSFRPRSES